MEVRVLRYFVEAARRKSITRAAEALHVTQPTLSRQLKDLESELGQKLFVRSNYSIQLTPEGRVLLQRALDILDMVDRTSAEFEAMADFTGGDLHMGLAESYYVGFVAQAFKRLLEKYPNSTFHSHSGNAEFVMDRVDKGLYDFGVVVQAVDLSKYNSLVVPSHDTWGLIMRKDDPLASQETIDISQLLDLPLITSEQGITEEMPDFFKQNQNRLHIAATFNLSFNASVLTREGVGYTLSFANLLNTGPDSDLHFVPFEPEMVSPMFLIWNRNQVLSKTARLFLDEFKEVIREPYRPTSL